MPQHLGWARARGGGADNLRRGAWYPVLSESRSDKLVLATGRSNVTVDTGHLERRPFRPAGFSVVFKTPDDTNPVAGTTEDTGLMYAVCPWSGSRIPLDGFPDTLECPRCTYKGPVLWEDAC